MSKVDLSTAEGVASWVLGLPSVDLTKFRDTETAAYIAECVRVAEITASAAAGPFDNTPEGRTASRRVMTRIVENERLRERAKGLYDRAVFTKSDLETLATAEDDKYFGDYLLQIEFGCPWDASAEIECCGHHVLSAQQHRAQQNERLRAALDNMEAAEELGSADLVRELRNAMRGIGK